MKLFYLTAFSFYLLGCTPTKTQETHTNDSTSADTVSSVSEIPEEGTVEEYSEVPDEPLPLDDSLASAIRDAYDKLSAQMESGDTPYSISLSYDGYENGSESTWFFDSSFTLKYAKGSWYVEGTSSSYAYYFDGDNLRGYFMQENDYVTIMHADFKPNYGFTHFTPEFGGEETLTYVDETVYNSNNTTVNGELSTLLNYFRTNIDSVNVSDQEASIHNESIADYGMEVTITEDYSMSRALFDKLIKEE